MVTVVIGYCYPYFARDLVHRSNPGELSRTPVSVVFAEKPVATSRRQLCIIAHIYASILAWSLEHISMLILYYTITIPAQHLMYTLLKLNCTSNSCTSPLVACSVPQRAAETRPVFPGSQIRGWLLARLLMYIVVVCTCRSSRLFKRYFWTRKQIYISGQRKLPRGRTETNWLPE